VQVICMVIIQTRFTVLEIFSNALLRQDAVPVRALAVNTMYCVSELYDLMSYTLCTCRNGTPSVPHQ
jgi:hypothetical protein